MITRPLTVDQAIYVRRRTRASKITDVAKSVKHKSKGYWRSLHTKTKNLTTRDNEWKHNKLKMITASRVL